MIYSKSLFILASVILFSCTDRDDSPTADSRNSDLSEAPIIDSSHNNLSGANNTAAIYTDYSTAEGPAAFANEAATGGLMEVNLAKYAQNNASSQEVKSYAKMLNEDHGKANADLKKIATAKNMTIPSAMGTEKEAMVNQMKSVKGAEFDKVYINMMVDDHTKDLQKFQDAAAKLPDAELKAFAAATVPVLQKHLDKAKELQLKF